MIQLKTVGDVFDDFIAHAECKAADAMGVRATVETVGQLGRLRIIASSQRHISKAARKLEVNQIIGSASEAYREHDLGWYIQRPRLRKHSRLRVSEVSGLSRSQVYNLLDGSAKPNESTYAVMLRTLDVFERE